MFFEEYILEPLKYASSSKKRIFIGGVLYLLGSFGVVFGIWDILSSILILIPEIDRNLSPSYILHNKGFAISMLSLNSSASILLGIILIIVGMAIFCILSGYTYRVINYTLNDKNTLPRWKNCKHLFYRGTTFLMGILLLSIIFDAPNTILRMTINTLYPQYFMGSLFQMPFNIVLLSTFLIILSIIISIVEWLYTPLAAVNFVKRNDFFGFFQVNEIFSKMSLKYVAIVISLILISTILWILCFLILTALTICVSLVFNLLMGLAMAVVVGCFTIPFLAFYLRIFKYRAYSKYYKNINN